MFRKTFIFLFYISTVHPWTTFELKYKICDQDKTSIVNYDYINKGVYTSLDTFATSDSSTSNVNVTMQGCDENCSINFNIILVDNKPKLDPAKPLYTCDNSGETFEVDIALNVKYTNETTPNPEFQADPSVTYEYCMKNISIETGKGFANADKINGVAFCIDALTNITGSSSFSTKLNLFDQKYLTLDPYYYPPSTARLIESSINYLAFLTLNSEATESAFIDLADYHIKTMVDVLQPKNKPPPKPKTTLKTVLKTFAALFSIIDFKPFVVPFRKIGNHNFGGKIQNTIGGAISLAADQITPEQNKEIVLNDLSLLQQSAKNSMTNAMQDLANSQFLNGNDYKFIDNFISINSTNIRKTDLSDGILKTLYPIFASNILNFYDIIVCDPATQENACKCDYCYDDTKNKFMCNKPVADNCIFAGGYSQSGAGINYEFVNALGQYGDLADACAIRQGESRGGWNLIVDDCMYFRNCCNKKHECYKYYSHILPEVSYSCWL